MERKKLIRKNMPNKSSARRRNFKKRQKRKLFFKRLFIITIFLAICGSIIYGFAVLLGNIFCIKEIAVEGNCLYSDAEILGVSGIHQGEGMLFLNTQKSEKQIYKSFPYVDSVSIQKQFPGKISVKIETAERVFSIFRDDVYYILSANGKLLEKVSEPPSETIELRVPEFDISESGKIDYKDDGLDNFIKELRSEFLNVGIGNIKIIDLMNTSNMVVNYDGRISIMLGGKDDLHYKIVTAKEIISNKINKFEKGELDLRDLSKENKSYFTPESR